MQGWIFDAYADPEKDRLVLWLWSRGRAHRIEDAYRPSFFVHAPPDALREFRERLGILDGVREARLVRRRVSLERREKVPVLEVLPRRYADLQDLARTIDSNGRYHGFRLYNVDLRLSQRYFLHHRIFPMGLVSWRDGEWRAQEEQFALDYELPPLRAAVLDVAVDAPLGIPRLTDPLRGARLGEVEVGGSESEVLERLNAAVREVDPDVLLTDGGDAFLLPYLAGKAEALGIPLRLGRDPDPVRPRKGKSYFTYGKIVYKPAQYLLRGRLHLDRGHFAYRESDLAGLAELSRLSCLVPQEQARLTPGTAITAMQVNQAWRDGVLVLWKKNRPEDFKTAEDLLLGDRGGFTFEPEVGLHENLLEVDFASLYPNIMAKFNISPETLSCECCREDGRRVPGLAYHTCVREKGLIGRVLQPVIERKRYFKRMKREKGPKQAIFEGRDTILKWLLVTCLDGETIVPHRRRGETAVSTLRKLIDPSLPRGGECPPSEDLRVFSIDSRGAVVERRVRRLLKAPAPPRMLAIHLRNGSAVLATPNHRFFVRGSAGLDEVLAANLAVGAEIPWAQNLPLREGAAGEVDFVPVTRIEEVPPAGPWVYCLGVDGEPSAFFCNGGLLTGNSFGYTGYKNARFGRIECHEAINAYAREVLLHAMEVAESHGYEVVHGIVDSLWLRPTARSDAPERVVEHIAGATGLPLDIEGTYRWVVFLPAKTGVGALNRYYGVFRDGELKLRGIELRKHDTCGLVNRVQAAMLAELAKASNAAEFREQLPRALEILRGAAVALREGLVPLEHLVLTKSVTREVEEYSVFTNVVAALKQLEARGFAAHPGESVRFVVTRQSARDPEAKVRVAEFLTGEERPDVEEYLKLLARSAETLLAPFGHTEAGVLEDLRICSAEPLVPAEGESLARVGVGYHASPR